MISLAVSGAGGRMGRTILSLAEGMDVQVTGALDPVSKGLRAADISDYRKTPLTISDDPEEALRGARVVIDFSVPAATLDLLKHCEATGTAMVIGVTGFSLPEQERLDQGARRIAMLQSPNMSLGVNWLFRLVAESARALQQYEVEITEAHHRFKKDAPSGTAVRLRDIILESRPDSQVVYGREGKETARSPGEVGIHALRGGDIVGEHTVYFIADGERIEITHRATSRETFARGALQAAIFLCDKPAGRYGMQDVLG
ncbi:MAG: 4-hydroxy-tetrahydrodipicolinate reductase [Spirochaetales bacterium]|nr:4-hydroxy-tetrahydrodipicolinate reductase [Spirochaetales bacterium]